MDKYPQRRANNHSCGEGVHIHLAEGTRITVLWLQISGWILIDSIHVFSSDRNNSRCLDNVEGDWHVRIWRIIELEFICCKNIFSSSMDQSGQSDSSPCCGHKSTSLFGISSAINFTMNVRTISAADFHASPHNIQWTDVSS